MGSGPDGLLFAAVQKIYDRPIIAVFINLALAGLSRGPIPLGPVPQYYLYALIYALGPVLSAYLTGDLTVGFVWRVMAGGSANYIYYWHIKEHLTEIRKGPPLAPANNSGIAGACKHLCPLAWGRALHHALFCSSAAACLLQVIREGPIPTGPVQPGKVKPTAVRMTWVRYLSLCRLSDWERDISHHSRNHSKSCR